MPELGIITMSTKELSRLGVIEKVAQKELTQNQGAHQLNISIRQVRRLVHRYRQEGPSGLRSKKRGQVSNNKLDSGEVSRIVALINKHYPDFGPTLALEKLEEHHEVKVSVESLRTIMTEHGLWEPKSRKRRVVYQSRPRRSCFGELVQIDGSPHAWFEDRGPQCTLIVFIDDATSAFVDLRFYPSETTQAYMESAKRHLSRYGRPAAYYSDKHSIFKSGKEGGEYTQFGRALKALDIELICANSPQAKGRVERSNQLLQDRLVKELRLRNISTIDEANQFLEHYREVLNEKFAKAPASDIDAHQSVAQSSRELELILCPRETRTASKQLELSYKNLKLQLPKNKHRLKGAKITVCDLYSGPLVLMHDNKEIEYSKFELPIGPSIETDKTINVKVDSIVKTRKRSQWKPASNHPWRTSNLSMKKSAAHA